MRQPSTHAPRCEPRQDAGACISRLGALLLVAEGEWEKHLQQETRGQANVHVRVVSRTSARHGDKEERPGMAKSTGAVHTLVSNAVPAAHSAEMASSQSCSQFSPADLGLPQSSNTLSEAYPRSIHRSSCSNANPLNPLPLPADRTGRACEGKDSSTSTRKRVRWAEEDQNDKNCVSHVFEYEYPAGHKEELEERRDWYHFVKTRLPFAQATYLEDCARTQSVGLIEEARAECEASAPNGNACHAFLLERARTNSGPQAITTTTMPYTMPNITHGVGAGGTAQEQVSTEITAITAAQTAPKRRPAKAAKRPRKAEHEERAEEEELRRATARRLAMLEFEAAVIRRSLTLCAH